MKTPAPSSRSLRVRGAQDCHVDWRAAGLSAPDRPGAYLSFAPRAGLTDAERNCVSNINGSGLSYDEAAFRIAWLIRKALAREFTGSPEG